MYGTARYGIDVLKRKLGLSDVSDPKLIAEYMKIRAERPDLPTEEALGYAMDRLFLANRYVGTYGSARPPTDIVSGEPPPKK